MSPSAEAKCVGSWPVQASERRKCLTRLASQEACWTCALQGFQAACLTRPASQEVVDDPGGNKMLLVMDYMEGGPVLTREGLERGRRIPEPLALQYFRDMCKVCCSVAR